MQFSLSKMNLSSKSLSLVFLAASCFATSSWAQDSDLIRWKGDTPCDNLFEMPVLRLPGGSPLTEILGTEDVQGKYQLSGGGVLTITIRKTLKVPVHGLRYSDAIADLHARRPLQDAISRKTSPGTVLADVKSLFGMRAIPYELEDGTGFALKPKSLWPKVTAKVRVADWQGYAGASPLDQRKWEGHSCESYHHELGHILVTAQILEAAEKEFLAMRAPTKEEINQSVKDFLVELSERIETRQQDYHDEIEAMGRSLSYSRPYMELPFSWLNQDDIDLAQP